MPQAHPLAPLRGRVSQTLAVNAGLLEMAPASKRDDAQPSGESRLQPLTALPGGVADAVDHATKHHWPAAATKLERLAKPLARGALKGVPLAGDALEYATEKDKLRAAAGIAGSRAGALVGAAIPGAEFVTIPVGAVVGNWAGHELYDHRNQIRDAIDTEMDTLRDQWARELAHMVPYDLTDRIRRR